MPHKDRTAWVEDLNQNSDRLSTFEMLAMTHRLIEPGRLALVSSFGAEAVVLLHLVAQVDPDLPVLFIDTRLLFVETLQYQNDISKLLGLTNVQVIRADAQQIARSDPFDRLHLSNPNACCSLRKTDPLNRALQPYDGWISGRKQFQGNSRAGVAHFELDSDGDKVKINPLAHWTAHDIAQYLQKIICPITRWSPWAIPQSAACRVPHPSLWEKTPGRGVGPDSSKPNAAFTAREEHANLKEKSHDTFRHYN